jgi:hypothetical protein
VADDDRPSEYKAARQLSGVLIFVLVAVLALLDALRSDFELSPLVLGPLLIAGAALFAVDLPGVGRK